ncbi:MAG: AAA family ATPase [Cyclobacteriaceae bacterium]|nr:AAA family ATPase [Cyclobacteriaceae bacterium]MCH8515023.1 AAA family ATPase [Cyclobacteriaceae bacterium]
MKEERFARIQKVRELLQQEREEDRRQYLYRMQARTMEERKRLGVTWYPLVVEQHFFGSGERLMIELRKGKKDHYSHGFQSGRPVSFFCASDESELDKISGVVNYSKDDRMMITLNADELPEWINRGKLGVNLLFDEISYKEMDIALGKLLSGDYLRANELLDIAEGRLTPQFSESKTAVAAAHLNESQQAALQLVAQTQDIGLIHGPPGTGKTTTLVEAIFEVAKQEHQVLVVAPSNAAVDLLTEKCYEKQLNVVRIGHPARVTESILNQTLDMRVTQHRDYGDLKKLKQKREEYRTLATKYKRSFGAAEREQRRLLFQEADQLRTEARALEDYILNDVLEKAQVILCTLVGASNSQLRSRKFKTVFIDEAAQSLEPACWIALLKAQRVIFAGDHQQLPPTVKLYSAAKAGLSYTLFERIMHDLPSASQLLTTQYRMNEQIMQFSSGYFYDNKLEAHSSVKHHRLTAAHDPILFVDTAGTGYSETEDPETGSKSNKKEAQLLMAHFEALVRELKPERINPEQMTIGIVSPYRAQVKLLQELFDENGFFRNIKDQVTIQSIDAFQGQERDIIYLSLVRSNEVGEIGFLKDYRRMNVGLTRARKYLAVFGDSATIGGDPFYATFLKHVDDCNAYRSAFEYEDFLV